MCKHSVLPYDHSVIYSPFLSATDLSYEITFLWIEVVEIFMEPLKASSVRWSLSLSDNNRPQTALSIALPVIRIDTDIYFPKPLEFLWPFHYLWHRFA